MKFNPTSTYVKCAGTIKFHKDNGLHFEQLNSKVIRILNNFHVLEKKKKNMSYILSYKIKPSVQNKNANHYQASEKLLLSVNLRSISILLTQ